MLCACLITFILTISGGAASIAPESMLWSPKSCIVQVPRWSGKPGPSIMFQQQYRDGYMIVYIPLPSIKQEGVYAYRYCWGHALVEINGFQRSVIIAMQYEAIARFRR